MSSRVRLTGWRRIANAMWRPPNDPQVYGALEVRATTLLRFVNDAKEVGVKVTPTHLVGRAIALALRDVPELNVRIVGGAARPRESVDVFFIASAAQGRDLTGVKIADVDRKGVFEVASELTAKNQRVKAGEDADLARSKRLTDALPMPALRVMLRVAAFVTGDAGLEIPPLGLARSPFGSAAVTSIATFGLPIGFAPLSWMYRVPLLVLVGTIEDKPVAEDGRVEVRPVLPITATIDHRFVDGWHISRAMHAFRNYLESPSTFEPEATRRMGAISAARPS